MLVLAIGRIHRHSVHTRGSILDKSCPRLHCCPRGRRASFQRLDLSKAIYQDECEENNHHICVKCC